LQSLLLLAFVFFRLIDYDEGLFLSYAKLVKEGNLPYLDFFHPQMPYLPYAYCMISQCGFYSLFLSRLISAFFGLLTSVIFFWFLLKFTHEARLSLFLFFLYSLNGLTINWHSVVKTLVFSDFFALLSFCCFAFYLLREYHKRHPLIFLSGLFIGVALSFRLVLFPILLVEGSLIFVLSTEKITKREVFELFLLLFGAVIGSLLSIYLFIRSPSAFLFGNIGYHLIWGNQVIRMTLVERLFTLSKFIFYPQNLLIMVLTGLGVTTLIQKIKKGQLEPKDNVIIAALVCSLVLIITCFFMSPTQLQYYEQALPYLLILSIPGWHKLSEKSKSEKAKTIAISASYFLFLLPFVVIFIFTVRQKDKPFELSTVRNVVSVIENNSESHDLILSPWPGYAVLSGRKSVTGLETWGGGVIPLLSSKQLSDFKLIDDLTVEKLIQERKVSLIVTEDWFPAHIENLIQINYDLVNSTPFADIYVTKNR
jgi:hypothetical protein